MDQLERFARSRVAVTTGEVGKILKVSSATAKNLMDKGIIPYHRIPTSEHRRALLCNVIKAAKEYNVPITIPASVMRKVKEEGLEHQGEEEERTQG